MFIDINMFVCLLLLLLLVVVVVVVVAASGGGGSLRLSGGRATILYDI